MIMTPMLRLTTEIVVLRPWQHPSPSFVLSCEYAPPRPRFGLFGEGCVAAPFTPDNSTAG